MTHEERDRAAALLETTFAQIPVGLAILDERMRFVRVNAAFAGMDGSRAGAHLDRTPSELYGPGAAVLERALDAVLSTGRPRTEAALAGGAFGPAGTGRHFEATYAPLHAPDGRTLGVSVVISDVSERERLRAADERWARRAQLRAEIGTALESTRGAQARMQRLVELLVPTFADAAIIEPVDTPLGIAPTARAGPPPAPDADVVVVSLAVRGRPVGTLTVARTRERRPFDGDERLYAQDVADRSAMSIDNERLYEQEQETALVLQRSMLAGEQPSTDGIELAVSYRPTPGELELAGGDWYDAVARPDGRLVLVVGDVVGHGLPAATAMGQLRSAGRALALTVQDPGDLLVHLDAFAERTPGAASATVVCVVADPASGELRYACAGHPPPLTLWPGERPRFLGDGRSVPLATFPAPARASARATLPAGALLLLYSDGLVERRGETLDDGLARLSDAIAGLGAVEPAMLAEQIAPIVLGDVRQRDDIAVLVARRH